MTDILRKLADQFTPDEQAEIREAEASAREVEASGEAAVIERTRMSTSLDRDWRLAPRDAARANAAGIEFRAYCNMLWRRTNAGSPESIREFAGNLDKVVQGVVGKY